MGGVQGFFCHFFIPSWVSAGKSVRDGLAHFFLFRPAGMPGGIVYFLLRFAWQKKGCSDRKNCVVSVANVAILSSYFDFRLQRGVCVLCWVRNYTFRLKICV